MSAKPGKNRARPAAIGAAPAATAPAVESSAPAAATAADSPSWLDSSDPRKRQFGKIVLAGVWLYVAALWLLALDQTFHWGLFGPTLPPLP